MTRAEGAIDIAAPANVVWDWIVEPEKYLVWSTDFTEYTIVDDKDERVGTIFFVIGVRGGGPAPGPDRRWTRAPLLTTTRA